MIFKHQLENFGRNAIHSSYLCLCMPSSKTDIDELILLEQEVNLLNGPIVLLQLLRLLLPATEPFDLVFRNTGRKGLPSALPSSIFPLPVYIQYLGR